MAGGNAGWQVVGFAGEDDNIEIRFDIDCHHRLYRQRDAVAGAFYLQALLGELLGAPFANQKSDISPGLHQASAKVTTCTARAQD